MTDPDDLGEADLHLAATMPAMVPIINVPWMVLVTMTGITVELVYFDWHLGLISAPVWVGGIFLFRKDHNGMRILLSWLRTAFLDCHAWWFGGTSVEVFPTTYRGEFRGIPHAE